VNKWLILSAGGLAGTLARYLMATWVPGLVRAGFPYGTLAVNASACFLVGLVDGLGRTRGLLGPEARLLLITGFCGAYSTFSSWLLESCYLLADGQLARASMNVFGSVAIGLLLLRLGLLVGAAL
jgi:fluoride exporter